MDFGFAASVLAAESMFGLDWETNSRCELLYYGVDCKPFEKPRDASLRALLGIPQDAFVIGHVGRFHEQKNHEFLVRVVEETAARSPTAHCLLIGDGPLRAEVEADIKGRNLQDRFTFVPDTTEPADYMTSVMDCFVFPSRYEGLGLVAVEAQAAGLPCIISERVPSEAIVDASLVKVLTLDDSAAEWAEATLALANRKSGSADAARRQVRDSRFNLDHCVAALCARYMGLAGR
jgi:glycosyltransferase involved in cell wall biosynthesis